MPFVYSTLSSDQNYNLYESNPNDVTKDTPKLVKSVYIKGGANVMPKRGNDTPAGHETEVSDEALELLNANPVFQMHVDNGHIKVLKSKKPIDKATSDMKAKDESAPMTEESFKNTEVKPSLKLNK